MPQHTENLPLKEIVHASKSTARFSLNTAAVKHISMKARTSMGD